MKPTGFTILFLAAAIAGLSGIYALVAEQESQQREAIDAQIAARQRAADELRRATAGAREVREKVSALSRAVASVESKLVPEHDLNRTVRDIWQLADANSLQTQMIQPMPIRHEGNFSEQPVELQLTGDFSGFYAFMLQLERLPRLVRLTQMDLRRLSDSDGAMAARLTIGIFYQPNTGQIVDPVENSATAEATPR